VIAAALMFFSVSLGVGCIAYVLWATREIEREARDITARDERTLPADFHLGERE
jgi:hypothetical protein